jgi:hypothetical protein
MLPMASRRCYVHHMRMLLLVLAACAPARPDPGGSSIDAPIVHDAPAPSVCYEPSVSGSVMPGMANLQSCAIWNNVANMTGTVTLSRTGEMLAMAFASGVSFAGTIAGTSVTLTNSQLHSFTDGCTWRATETLSGTLDPASCVMTLSYAYNEMVAVSNGACATPCTGTADFSLQIAVIQ